MSAFKRNILTVVTCPSMHDHGTGQIRLSYDAVVCPLTFRIATNLTATKLELGIDVNKPVEYDMCRETVHMWLAMAPAGALLELGDVSIKVRLSRPQSVVFKLPRTTINEDYEMIPMFIMKRESLQHFLADTYVVTPAETEETLLKIDDCIAKIFESSK